MKRHDVPVPVPRGEVVRLAGPTASGRHSETARGARWWSRRRSTPVAAGKGVLPRRQADRLADRPDPMVPGPTARRRGRGPVERDEAAEEVGRAACSATCWSRKQTGEQRPPGAAGLADRRGHRDRPGVSTSRSCWIGHSRRRCSWPAPRAAPRSRRLRRKATGGDHQGPGRPARRILSVDRSQDRLRSEVSRRRTSQADAGKSRSRALLRGVRTRPTPPWSKINPLIETERRARAGARRQDELRRQRTLSASRQLQELRDRERGRPARGSRRPITA